MFPISFDEKGWRFRDYGIISEHGKASPLKNSDDVGGGDYIFNQNCDKAW